MTRYIARISTVVLLAGCSAEAPQEISGMWDAVLTANDVPVPFRMELSSEGGKARGVFFDGDLRIASTQGTWSGRRLHARWEYLDGDLDASLANGVLRGKYIMRRSGPHPRPLPFEARRFVPVETGKPGSDLSVAGHWEVRPRNGAAKDAWKLSIRQSGAEVTGAILRLDGDTGTLSGTFRNRKLVMSHFSGARPALLEGTLGPDGALNLVLNRKLELTAVRVEAARARGLPEPPDPSRYTRLRDPGQPFRFRFPDVSGRLASESDPRFQGKVLIVNISGSWCPNCNDEAPFLVELYHRYHAEGLEIVGLQFESGDLSYDRERVLAFAERHKIPYPLLLSGTTDDVQKKLPSLVNFAGFPTTLFLARDGRVRSVYSGYASQATLEEHARLKAGIAATVERLLREQPAR